MGFAGNLRTLSLAEVVQTLNRVKADGVLRLASSSATRDVVFSQGEIISVRASDGSDRRTLLKRLVLSANANMPSSEELDAADQTISTLVEIGTIATDDLKSTSEEQALEELYDLNTWPSADFVFYEITENEEWNAQVEAARLQPLSININAVLMEAARRLDEWEVLKGAFEDSQVIDLDLEKSTELEKFTSEYPGSLIVPLLVKGSMAIEDLLIESGVTRFATYALLTELREAGLLSVLSLDVLAEEADQAGAGGDHVRAALLYRRALAGSGSGSRVAVMDKLASSLEQAGDAPRASGCYVQLAIAQMDEGNGDPALQYAKRAVELASEDPATHAALARCLIGSGKFSEAIAALRSLAELYKKLGRIEDIRVTFIKILELAPGDNDARHALAAIQVRQASGESADVVVCIECGTVNNRELDECGKCHARLSLQCLTCSRAVSIADKVCVFCGADPHEPPVAGSPKRHLAAGPATERVSDPGNLKDEVKGKGSSFWRAELRHLLDAARAHEEAGRYEEALKAWREMARLQQNNAELSQHIRELEGLIHDEFTELEIERGHRLKRQRHYWRALLAYRAALRSLGDKDPRVPRLRELIASTSRSNTFILAIYLSAFAIILVTAALVAKPYLDVRMIQRHVAAAKVELVGPAPTAEAIIGAADELATLSETAEKMTGAHRNRAMSSIEELRFALIGAREIFLASEMVRIEGALRAKSPDQALALIAKAGTVVGSTGDERLKTAKERAEQAQRTQQDLDKRRSQAPELLAKAKAEEESGRFAGALRIYREIAGLGAGESSDLAKAGMNRLEPQAEAFASEWKEIDKVTAGDLLAGKLRLEQLATVAGNWDASETLANKLKDVSGKLLAAETAWKALEAESDEKAFDAFLANHASAPQARLARARLAQLKADIRVRDSALAQYREAVTAKQWESAFTLATALHHHHRATLKPGEVRIPVVIESEPAGATLNVDGVDVGPTPIVFTYEPKSAPRQMRLTMPGYRPRQLVPNETLGTWRNQVSLHREAFWSVPLGSPIGLIAALPDGGCVVSAGDALIRLKPDGTQSWTHILQSDELEDAKTLTGPAPLILDDGRMAIAVAGAGFVLLSESGQPLRVKRGEAPVLGRPVRYKNEIFGGQERLAFASDALYVGALDAEPGRLELPAPALGGPLVLTADLDRLLVVADTRGHFVAVEESTKLIAWDKDLRFTEVTSLVQTAADAGLGIVDGSRLVAWKFTTVGAQEAWSQRLAAPASGSVAVHAGVAHVASAQTVIRIRLDGVALPALTLPSPASAGAAAGSDHLAIGCREHVVVFKEGRLAWISPCTAPVTAIAVGSGLVLVGLADGTISAFKP